MKKKGTTVTTKRGGRGLLFLILGMLALTFGLTAIFAALMEGGSIPEEKTGLLAAITVGAVSLAACVILAARAQEKKLLRGILGAAIYAVMLLLGNLLFFGVGYTDVLPILMSILAGGVVGSILGSVKKKKRKFG